LPVPLKLEIEPWTTCCNGRCRPMTYRWHRGLGL
jgi:hypothetical protein